jgi:hypothetical protein
MDASPPTQDALRSAHEEIGSQAKALPYLAAVSSAKALVVPDKPFTEFPGLQAVQRVRHSSAGDTVITYWSSEDHFEMNRAALSDKLGAPVSFSGGLGALEAPTKPWWKRYTPLQILLTLSGIAGAVQVLVSNYEKVAAPPELAVTLEKADGQHAVEGEPFTAKATLENFLSSVNHRQVTIEAALQPTSGPAIPLSVPDSPLAGLGSGKSHTFTIVGKVPSRGTYNLEVVASAKAGLLSNRASFKAKTSLRAWADEPEPSPLRVASRPAFPIIVAQVEVGRDAPAGVVCSATFKIVKPGGLVMDWFLTRPHTADFGAYGSEVIVVKWTWPKLSGRTAPVAEWSFKGVPLEEMKEMARTAQTRCIAKESNV